GRVSYEYRTLVARKGGEFDRIDGFVKAAKVVHFGAGDRIDTMGDPASILCQTLNIACKIITGYPGAVEVGFALQRGEVDALVVSESQALSYMRGDLVAAVAILGPGKAPQLPNVPSIFDLVELSAEQSKWLCFRAELAEFGRTLIMPGDTPP